MIGESEEKEERRESEGKEERRESEEYAWKEGTLVVQ